jgi:hypothetical protein
VIASFAIIYQLLLYFFYIFQYYVWYCIIATLKLVLRVCSDPGERKSWLRPCVHYTNPSRYDRRSSLQLAPPSYLSSTPRVFLRLARVRAVLNSRTRLSTRTHTRTRASTPVLAPKPSMSSCLASPPRCFPPLFVCPTGTRCAVP